MKYKILKFHFNTAVHFGDNNLSDTNNTFSSDILFSAICVEKAKTGDIALIDEMIEIVNTGKLLFSDAFPYIGNEYFLPKPIMHIDGENNESDSGKKKAYKKMSYINIKDFDKFVKGDFDNPEETNKTLKEFGDIDVLTRVSISNDEPRPYQVGAYRYKNNAGLYVIVAYEDENIFNDIFDVVKNIGISGIGGKKTSGLGKFDVEIIDEKEDIYRIFVDKCNKNANKYMTLSISLPQDEEMNEVLDGATYALIRKGGFVDTTYENINKIKKKDIYLFKCGSCFSKKYEGDVYNISFDENNKIYKYAKPLWIGV